jgi:hypothetical protein
MYLLSNLYDETGQREKSFKAANKILQKKTKVESEATEEMRSKMGIIIERYN